MSLLNKIDRLYGQDKLERALGLLNKALDREPADSALLRRRAQIAAELGHRNLALRDLEQLLQLQADDPEHWILKAQLQDDFFRGLGILERALRRLPDDSSLLIAKAQHFAQGGRHREALAVLVDATRTRPHDATLWLARAELRHQQTLALAAPARSASDLRRFVAETKAALADVEKSIVLAPTPAARDLRSTLESTLHRDSNAPAAQRPAPQARQSLWARLWPSRRARTHTNRG